ncbi:MAG: Cache 3/Cache 2 fusion domain-containing protein [Alphaproteobacteria bacterium]|nr:Cache 3/Cache 2 fusion domain-containing protein [Alphaproteobacteria bacterium]MBO6861503.1 Cache 3/Cache 2 fusion domain-containing protein [Alphaproteobacteria bacterium]
MLKLRLKLRTRLVLIVLGLISLAAAAVGGSAIYILEDEIAAQVIERQNASLRTAAVLLRKTVPETQFTITKAGRVTKLTLPEIPDFPDHSMIDEIGSVTGETATVFEWEDENRDFWRRTTNIIKDDGSRAVGTQLGHNGRVYPYMMRGETYLGEATILGKDYYTIYEPIRNPKGDTIGILYAGVLKSNVRAAASNIVTGILVATVLSLLVCAGIALLLVRGSIRPMLQLTEQMIQVSKGNTKNAVPYTDRSDELGDMARALDVFRENAEENAGLVAQQAERQAKSEEEKRDFIKGIATQFREKVGGIIQSLGEVSSQSEGAIRHIVGSAGELRDMSQKADRSANDAASSVNEASAVTSDLSASIQEIGRRSSDSARDAQSAAQQTESVNEKVAGLQQAADRVGEVVKLINDIAEQTNLLALNATIEAARAGEAGKGFAVVANEVKGLATQTGKATGEIAEQIASIQSAIQDAGGAIGSVVDSIRRISSGASEIADMVDAQVSATEGISSNIEQAQSRTMDVSNIMGAVRSKVDDNESGAKAVEESSRRLNDTVRNLKQEVDGFLKQLAD